MSPMRERNLWRTGFLGGTAVMLLAECVAAWDGNPNTDPWTDLITTYVPWQLALAVFGALVVWVPVHFIVAYRRRRRRVLKLDQRDEVQAAPAYGNYKSSKEAGLDAPTSDDS